MVGVPNTVKSITTLFTSAGSLNADYKVEVSNLPEPVQPQQRLVIQEKMAVAIFEGITAEDSLLVVDAEQSSFDGESGEGA